MSQENVESLRQPLEACDRRDRSAWIAVRDDQEFELATSREWSEGGLRGRESTCLFYVQAAEAFERRPYSDEVEVVDAGDDKVLVQHRAEALQAAGLRE